MPSYPTPSKIRRVIFDAYGIRVTSTTQPETFIYNEKGSYSATGRWSSTLSLELNPPGQRLDYRLNSIFITDTALNRLIAALDEVIAWFYDPKMKDMFYQDASTKELIFNAEYNGLKKVFQDSNNPPRPLTIMPSLVEMRDRGVSEGVSLYIGDALSSMIGMTLRRLEAMRLTLSKFDFYLEPLLAIESVQYAMRLNQVTQSRSLSNRAESVVHGTVTAPQQPQAQPKFILQ